MKNDVRLLRRLCTAILAMVVMAVAATPVHAQLQNGLLNYWPLDGNLDDSAHGLPGSASTVADNGIFDGTNGTGGISFAAGLFGDAIEQDGAGGGAAGKENNGFVRVTRSADTLQGGEDVSISAWFRTDGFDSGWQTLISHGEGETYRIARRGSSEVMAYAGGHGDIPDNDTTGPAVGVDTGWHHVVGITETGVATRLYVDGSFVFERTDTAPEPLLVDDGNSNPPDPDLFIGGNPQTGDNNREWWGSIDDVATWDRPLDESEITLIYDAGRQGVSLGQIPEPTSLMLAAVGLLALGLYGWRRGK